jgi:hypothetical protein
VALTWEVILQLKAAEESALPLTAVNIVTAMHRVAKTSAAGRLLRQEDALLLLRLVDGELKSGTDSSALDDRALTTLAWSLGSLYQTFTDKAVDGRRLEQHEQHEELPQHVQRLLGRIIQLLQSRSLSHIPAQGLSNVAWSCAKCNLRGNETALLLDRISTVLQAGRAERSWNAQDLSNLAWAYGRLRSGCSLGPQDLAALEAISTAALTLGLHGFWPQGLSNLLWAHASLGVRCDELCEAICNEAAARQLDGFSSQEISNLAWAATVIDGSMRGSLCGAISSWLQTADGFEGIFFDRAQEVSITLWAFAKAQAPCEQLVAYARQRVLDEPGWLGDFSCQALSNLVWSLAKLHSLHRESGDTSITIAQVLIEVERRTLQQFKAQEISQMLHALATSEGRVTAQGNALLHAFEEHALSRGLTEFEEKHLACISWVCGLRIKRSLVGQDAREASDDRSFGVPASFVRHHRTRRAGRVEVRIETLVRREALARGLERFLPRHLSQLIWANALADKSANDLLVALRHEVLVRRNSTLADFSEAALVHIAWSYARMLGQPSQLGHDLVLIVGEELDRRSLDTLHSRHVSTLLWAMARLGCDSARVFNSAEGWLGDMDLAELSDQSLVMVIWAMTTVSRASMKNLARVEGEMLRRGLGSFQPQELNAAVFAFSMCVSGDLQRAACHHLVAAGVGGGGRGEAERRRRGGGGGEEEKELAFCAPRACVPGGSIPQAPVCKDAICPC